MKYIDDYQDDDVFIALRNLFGYSKNPTSIDNAPNFLDFYNNTLVVLKSYSTETKNEPFHSVLIDFPILTISEVDEFRNHQETFGIRSFVSSSLVSLMNVLHVKTKKMNVFEKFRAINSITGHLIFILENPSLFKYS